MPVTAIGPAAKQRVARGYDPLGNITPLREKNQADERPGADDATTSQLTVKPRLRCTSPKDQILFTSVNA